MNTDLLIKAFRPLQLDPIRHDKFFELWQATHFRKGDFLTRQGDIERWFYVVEEGVQIIYLIAKNGDQKVLGFSYDGSFSGVYDSFLKGSGSKYYLQAIKKTSALKISRKDYDSLFDLYPEFNYWGRIAHQELLIGRVEREVELFSLNAKERFDKFMSRCPQPLLNIPQKYLASYLNMTPETYSRLRK
ncbi:MAG: Crp/Fnr family transcriptional regulator [Bacteroidota bacterium]